MKEPRKRDIVAFSWHYERKRRIYRMRHLYLWRPGAVHAVCKKMPDGGRGYVHLYDHKDINIPPARTAKDAMALVELYIKLGGLQA